MRFRLPKKLLKRNYFYNKNLPGNGSLVGFIHLFSQLPKKIILHNLFYGIILIQFYKHKNIHIVLPGGKNNCY